jgi:hypothetical protein
MTNYAVIENDKVTNVIVADSLEIAETVTGLTCIDITDKNAGINWDYVGGEFIAPPKVEPEVPTAE